MRKIIVVFLIFVVFSAIIGCSNSHFRYSYEGDYRYDPNLKQDVDRDRGQR